MASFRFYYSIEKSDLYILINPNQYDNTNLKVDLWEGGMPFFLLSKEIDCLLETNEFVLSDSGGAQEILEAMIKNELVKSLDKKVKHGGVEYSLYELQIPNKIS